MGELIEVALDADLLDGQGQIRDRHRLAVLEQPDLGEILSGRGDSRQFEFRAEQAGVDELHPVRIGVVQRRRLAQPDHGATVVQIVLAQPAHDHIAHAIACDRAAFLRRIDPQVINPHAKAAQLTEVGDVGQRSG